MAPVLFFQYTYAFLSEPNNKTLFQCLYQFLQGHIVYANESSLRTTLWVGRGPNGKMGMKIILMQDFESLGFEGDIVEIITAKYKSWNDIPLHERGYYENQREPAPTIGQRFRISWIYINERDNTLYANIKGKNCYGVSSDCVILYKRPLINWIKALFK